MVLLSTALLLAFSPQAPLQVQEREIHLQGETYGIHIKYPEVQGARQFNAAVHHVLDPLVERFKKEMPEALPPNSSAGDLEGHYTAAILKNGIVSVLLDWTEYYPGAAHTGGFMASINYDTRTRRMLALSDLFRPGVDYLARLSALAIASLERNDFADTDWIRRGAGPVESNFKVFTLTETALVLHFPTYQVAAGAAGPQEVVIPLDQLAPLLWKR